MMIETCVLHPLTVKCPAPHTTRPLFSGSQEGAEPCRKGIQASKMLLVFDLLLGIPLTSLERGFWPANLEDTEQGLHGRVEIWEGG